jgi:hypothetical protein
VTSEPELLTVEPRAVDRRLLVVLAVGVLVVALVLGGLAGVDRLRAGASSPTAVADRVLTALDHDDLGALARLVEPDERAALARLGGAWSRRLGDLGLPTVVGGGAPVPASAALDGLRLDVTGQAPRVAARAADVAVVDLGDVTVRVRSDPAAAHGLLRAWFAYRNVGGAQDTTYRATSLPELGALPRLVTVERAGRWYLSVLGTLLGPDVVDGGLPSVQSLLPATASSPRAAVESSLRALLDGRTATDVAALANTFDPSGSDLLQLWAAEVATTSLDRSPVPVTALRTTAGPAGGSRAEVRVETVRVGDGSTVDLSGRCLAVTGGRSCLHASGYRYSGGIGSLSAFELLGHDGAFSLTAVQGSGGWRTSVPESLTDALVAYGASLTREQVLMVLAQERLDAPTRVLALDQPQDVAFTSGGYVRLTVPVARPGLYRVAPSPDGANRASIYGPDGQPALQPFFPNDSVYRLTPGDHTLEVWADDAFARTLESTGGAPYVQRVEVHSVR